MSIDNPILVIAGVTLMALACGLIARWVPLLDNEERAHAGSLPLDGLRGILASSVFFHHSYITYVYRHTGVWAPPTSIFYGQLGPTAVTMFFFLSGFLFWKKMLKDPKTIRAARLWPNRLRRILPAYWTAVLCAFLAIAVTSGFEVLQPAGKTVRAAFLWLLVGFPIQPDLNRIPQELVTAGVYWTLRVELLFYFMLPFLIWFRRSWRPLLILGIAFLANRALHHWPSQNPVLLSLEDNLMRFTAAVLTGFSVGAIAAYLVSNPERFAPALRILRSPQGAVVGVLLLTAHLFLLKGTFRWSETPLIAPAFWMVACGNSFGGILTSRSLRSLGQISYSVYIFHGLILYSITSMVNRYHPIAAMGVAQYWDLMLVVSIVVVVISTVTYWYIERSFFRERRTTRVTLITDSSIQHTS